MKKIIVLFLVLVLAISAVGCGADKDQVLKMGFVPMKDGDTLIESVEPLTEMISKELGIRFWTSRLWIHTTFCLCSCK